MQFGARNDYDWEPAGTPGAEKYEIWRGSDNAYLVAFRVKGGTKFKPHAHAGWEHLAVVSGRWQLGDRVLDPGDVAITAPDESHDNEAALEDSLVIISIGNNDVVA